MKRSILRQIAREVAAELEKKTYEHWVNANFPLILERIHEGRRIQIEVHRLSQTNEYIQLGISVDGGGLSAFWHVGYSVVIRARKVG